jgi:hypothetical protein
MKLTSVGICLLVFLAILVAPRSVAELAPLVPPEERGTLDAERSGFHDAANIRTVFWNYGMVGDFPPDPGNVDLSVFHSAEVPKGSGMNYTDGITPFVLAKIQQGGSAPEAYIMETGYRERQGVSPNFNRVMRFEPRPGFFQADPNINAGRSPAISNDSRTWPDSWPDKLNDPDDPGWGGSWNGYFGKRPAADQESFTVMDDDFYDAWFYFPDARDSSRNGLGLRIEVRGFQWANPQAGNVIFWHYDITNEGTVDYDDNIIFGLYMDSGVGGSALSCDGIFESDDDNAFWDKSFGLNLVYTWDKFGHGVDLFGSCSRTGYLGYAYLETPGKPFDGLDNDDDGITDEKRDSGPGVQIIGQDAIRAYAGANYDMAKFEMDQGPLEKRPAFRIGRWWTGDEDMDWRDDLHDYGADGIPETGDTGELDGLPTAGEPYFDQTDLHESDQVGLTGFKMNRIRAGQGNPDPRVDDILFFTNNKNWPERLYEQFTDPNPAARFDSALAANYNIGFLFASGPFTLQAGQTERFSLALAYGADLTELTETVQVVQSIYNANYQFAVPPTQPTATAEAGDGFVRISWDDVAERSIDPVTGDLDFEGYRIYRSTDPEFRDPRVITTGRGTGPIGNGKPIAQFDLIDEKRGFSRQVVEGVAYWLGDETGITHTWTDTTVTNGQEYYYAVCAYDYGFEPGSDSLAFYPSENAIAVSRTPRGGTILPTNVVQVRPNPKVPGFLGANADTAYQITGEGVGSVKVHVVNSDIVPNNHLFKISYTTPSPDSIRARAYTLTDSTTGEVIFETGDDFNGEGSGPVGSGLLPVIHTAESVLIDSTRTGWSPGSATNAEILAAYQPSLPINLRRPRYPEDITVVFSDDIVDSSLAQFPFPALPAKFQIIAHGDDGDYRLDFRFLDTDLDGTLSQRGELIDIVTYTEDQPTVPQSTWLIKADDRPGANPDPIQPPAFGDEYGLRVTVPYGESDVFVFSTEGASVDEDGVKSEFASEKPYVVPNPYAGSASFEPSRFAISGRGERRIEFRAIPAGSVIRIYTVKGELVQTLRHDGSTDGYVAWNLRTKDNLDVAPGLYIFHVEAGGLEPHIGKFAVIK